VFAKLKATMIRPEMAHHYKGKWKQISKWLIARVGRCVNCGKTPGRGVVLTVHHIDFNPTNNDSSNLVVLCARCHLKKHATIQKYGRDTEAQLALFDAVEGGR